MLAGGRVHGRHEHQGQAAALHRRARISRVFPRADELWAWAHVHVNAASPPATPSSSSKDMAAVIPKLQAMLDENPDLAYSRLVCPRKLAREHGLPRVPHPDVRNRPARRARSRSRAMSPRRCRRGIPGTRPEGAELSVSTIAGTSAPARPATSRRSCACSSRSRSIRASASARWTCRIRARTCRGVDKPELGGILKLGGALRNRRANVHARRPPRSKVRELGRSVPAPAPGGARAQLINLPDDVLCERAPAIPDPDHHAAALRHVARADEARAARRATARAIPPTDNWVHRLNLDPRFRVAAGFGTRVDPGPAGKVHGRGVGADRQGARGAAAHPARRSSACRSAQIWYDRHLLPMLGVSRQQTLLLMAPLNKRILAGGVTVHHTLAESLVQPAMTSAALRRIIRPRGRLMRALPFDRAARRPICWRA